MANTYYLVVQNRENGEPYTEKEVKEGIEEGTVRPQHPDLRSALKDAMNAYEEAQGLENRRNTARNNYSMFIVRKSTAGNYSVERQEL